MCMKSLHASLSQATLVRVSTFANLGELRERQFRFSLDFVSRRTGIEPTRLVSLETGEAPSVWEAEALGELYALDADQVAEEPIKLASADSLTLLPLQKEFVDVSPDTRARILSACRAARDATSLKGGSGLVALNQRPRSSHSRGKVPFQQGNQYAIDLRRTLGLGRDPIMSMRDLLHRHFPEITVLHANLGLDGVAGIALADRIRGPAIVLNLVGKNENPFVRRFSLAHELAHLLFHRDRMQPFGSLSGFKYDANLAIEQEANGFAIRFLCPESELRTLAKLDAHGAVRELGKKWGVSRDAAHLYLKKNTSLEVPSIDQMPSPSMSVLDVWSEAERVPGTIFPLVDVPSERRTDVADYAGKAYSEGRISRDAFARLLGVTPEHDLERVLDYLSLDAPSVE